MDVVIVIVFILAFLASATILAKPRGFPPGPLILPFVGSLSIIRQLRLKRPHLVLFEAARKYGNVMGLKFGQVKIVVLTGYDTIHEALVERSDVFSDRPYHHSVFQFLYKNADTGIIFQKYDHHWKILRRFTLQTLRDFGVGKSSIEEKIMVEVKAVARLLQRENERPLRLAPLLEYIAGNVIHGIVFGQRYDYEDPEMATVQTLPRLFIKGSGGINPIVYAPKWLIYFLRRLGINKDDLERQKTVEMISAFIMEKIKEHEDSFDEENIRDFVDLYIQLSKKDSVEEKDTFTKEKFLRVIQDLFIAGSETTSTTLDWGFLYMIEYPDVQRKCQQEIERVVGDKPIEYADKPKLPHVDATINEIQRLASIVPLNVAHSTTKDIEFHGYQIPNGTLIFPMLYSASHDSKYWNDPETFNPERFLNKEGKLVKNVAHIPFSLGPRTCLGEPLARMELFLVFANLLQRFTFYREDEGLKHTMEAKNDQITNAPLDYKLRARRR